jgi:drug/metabolite transporter (DMT)-like permease
VFRRRTPRIGLAGVVYIVVGVIVANSHHYLENIHGLRGVVSAILAVALWPLILLGINLHVRR